MSRRKLSQRQRSRIADQRKNLQQEGEQKLATVSANFGRRAQLEVDGEQKPRRCKLRANIDTLVAGDRVTVNDDGVVTSMLDRRSVILRPDAYGKMRPVAANIDQVLIVIAPEPEPIENLIDRYLIAIALSDMKAVLVLNKCELSTNSERSLSALLAVYRSIDIPVLEVSAETGENMAALQQQLEDNTSVMVGQSGVGKSSLINTLAPELELKTGELSDYASKGTHTTTTALLCHLPAGGTIIDSPGIREFHLWHIDEHDVIEGFPEYRQYTDTCKFRNCAHQDDDGCALQQAWQDEKLNPERWHSYWRIRQSLLEKP